MKKHYLWILIFLFLFSQASVRAQVGDSSSVAEPGLREELLSMVRADQEAREVLIANLKSGGVPDSLDEARMIAIDEKNTARLKEIVEKYGWPDAVLVGRDGTEAAILLVIHAPDVAFQEKMLPFIYKAYLNGELDGQSYALLVDKIRVAQNRPQVYGTQFLRIEEWKDGEPVLHPVEDEAHLDERRAELGMIPLQEYIEFIKQLYNSEN